VVYISVTTYPLCAHETIGVSDNLMLIPVWLGVSISVRRTDCLRLRRKTEQPGPNKVEPYIMLYAMLTLLLFLLIDSRLPISYQS
jgi:hypothetical protein